VSALLAPVLFCDETTFSPLPSSATISLMERRDGWGVALVSCFILGFIVVGITATAVRFPNGGYDMQGMWMMAAAGFGAWILSTAVVAALWFRAHRRKNVAPKGR
jgi:hypothetical protein